MILIKHEKYSPFHLKVKYMCNSIIGYDPYFMSKSKVHGSGHSFHIICLTDFFLAIDVVGGGNNNKILSNKFLCCKKYHTDQSKIGSIPKILHQYLYQSGLLIAVYHKNKNCCG